MAINEIINNAINELNESKTLIEVLNVISNFFKKTGALHFNYTHLTQTLNSDMNFLKYHNYSEEWVKTYTSKKYSIIDPAVIYGKIYQKTAEWNHICNTICKNYSLNNQQKSLLKDMMFDVIKNNLANGIAVPITTTLSKQNGFYIAYNTLEQVPKYHILQVICFIFNNAFTTIANESEIENNIKFPFSPQERELIKLIYNGKERQDIAEIMNISINTVDTMTKRIFIKMRVNSKMQLIAKIIAKGWLGMIL